MQTRSFRGSGEPAWVIASSNACEGLGPDPRRALGPAATRAAPTGRTHDRTRPVLHQRKKALVNEAPSTHGPEGVRANIRDARAEIQSVQRRLDSAVGVDIQRFSSHQWSSARRPQLTANGGERGHR
jgi:hypothetical protein